MIVVLSALAISIILALTAVAIYFQWKLREQQKKQALALAVIEKTAQEKYQKIRKDIVFIAQSYLADQVELPEASLRISRLADLVLDERESRSNFQPFDQFAEAIAEIPTHADWKMLTKQERKRHEKTMKDLTIKHQDAARMAAKQIIEQNTALH